MTNTSIKIVRPWPAEQPRPPLTHRTAARRTERLKATAPADRQRPAKTKAA